MARILVLLSTTTYKAEAFLAAARHLEVAVVVGTNRRQVLSALNPTGNLTLPFDAPERAAERIVAYAANEPLDAIVAADDEGLAVAAHAAAALGLPHNSIPSVLAARDKLRTRQALAAAALPVPEFVTLTTDDDPDAVATRLEFPCVVKPLSLSASRGVIRADDPKQFRAAFRRLCRILRAATDATVPLLVERFIPGYEVALEGLVTAGRLRTLALFDKPDPLDGPFFEETLYVTPSRHPAGEQNEIVATTQRAITALGLSHGPVHAELRFNDRGAWLVELASRSIGGLCGRALRFGARGEMGLEELILRHALGSDARDVLREHRASGVMMIPVPKPGILRQVRGLSAASSVACVEDVRITIPRGGAVEPAPEGSRYLGFIFARADTAESVEAALRASHDRLEFDIEPTAVASTRASGSADDTMQSQ